MDRVDPLLIEKRDWVGTLSDTLGLQSQLLATVSSDDTPKITADDFIAIERALVDVLKRQVRIGEATYVLIEELNKTTASLGDTAKGEATRIQALQTTIEGLLQAIQDAHDLSMEAVTDGKAKLSAKADPEADYRSADRALQDAQGVVARADKAYLSLQGAKTWLAKLIEGQAAILSSLDAFNLADLQALQARIPLLTKASQVAAFDMGLVHVLRQHVLVVDLSVSKIDTLLDTILHPKSGQAVLDQMVPKMPKSTAATLSLVSDVRDWTNEALRYYGTKAAVETAAGTPRTERLAVAWATGSIDIEAGLRPVIEASTGATEGRGGKLVAVVGGGPVGLAAAIEARLKGAPAVTIFEARTKAYSRKNVLKLKEGTVQRFKTLGVYDVLFGGDDPIGDPRPGYMSAPTHEIETALLDKASALGVKFLQGWALDTVDADADSGRYKAVFLGHLEEPVFCDLVILAAGPGITRPRRDDGVVVSEGLDFEVTKQEVADLAFTAMLETAAPEDGVPDPTLDTRGWAYDFKPRDLDYIVGQLSDEQFLAFSANPALLRDYIQRLATTKGIAGDFLEDPRCFPIELQQAVDMTSPDRGTVLIGDSAATPHPGTGMGVNTGVAEIGAIGDLVTATLDDSAPTDGAMEAYDWELKARTDVMVNRGMKKMVENMNFYVGETEHRLRTVKAGIPKYYTLVTTIRSEAWAAQAKAEAELDGGGTDLPIANAYLKACRLFCNTWDQIAVAKQKAADGTGPDVDDAMVDGWKPILAKAKADLIALNT